MLFSTKHQNFIDQWQLSQPNKQLETPWSFLYWVTHNQQNMVLKIYKDHSNEAPSATLLMHYNGNGAVRVLKHNDQACLIEQVGNGHELVEITKANDDAKATEILCDVIKKLHAAPAKDIDLQPIDDFIADFDNYLTKPNVPHRDLVTKARKIYADLSASQTQKLNLHGDLHHYNVMQADDGEWLAIDPKGFWGEAEYELGAFLRNPLDDDYHNIDVSRRFEVIENQLAYDIDRIKQWAYCQAVLASVWADDDMVFAKRLTGVLG